jgi:hypothetical protein
MAKGATGMMSDRTPRRTIWWGVALAVGGMFLVVVGPMVVSVIITPSTQQSSDLYTVVTVLLSVARSVLPVLGCSLIAAGIVMKYMDVQWGGQRRWKWPASGADTDH